MLPKLKLPKIELSPLKQVGFIILKVGKLLWDTDNKALFWVVTLNILSSSLILPTLYIDRVFIDTLIKSASNGSWASAFNIILNLAILRFTLSIIRDASLRISGYHDGRLSRKFNARLDQLFAMKYTELDVPTIEAPGFQAKFEKIIRQGYSRARGMVNLFSDLPRYVVGAISALSIFIFSQPWIAIVSILLLIPVLIIDAKFTRRQYETEDRVRNSNRVWGMLNHFLTRARSYLEVRILRIRGYLVQKMQGVQQDIEKEWEQLSRERQVQRFWATLPETVFTHTLEIYLAFLAISQKISIGTAQAYLRGMSSFRADVRGTMNTITDFYENYLYVSELIWLFDLQPAKSPQAGKRFPKSIKQHVRFSNVWFKYPNTNTWILKGVDFEIGAKENVALIGENGAGKTTLMKLLAGFYTPNKGSITIDGIKVSDYKQQEYWTKLAVMPQEFERYDFSARDSIGYGNTNKISKLSEIRKYAQLVNIDKWINGLPLKYDTPLSKFYNGGVDPSGGQWQKIALARTLIKDSQMLVLDEPTSNVDPEAEEDIFNQVLKLGKAKILIFISHRFSTVRRADKILLLEDGKILEQGTHKQLMDLKKKYARLFHLQAKSYR